MIKTGIFTSEWDVNGAKFDTNGTLNTETGEVKSLETIDGEALEGLSCLTDEYFTDGDGEKYQICETCHQFITKVVMVDDKTGNGSHEENHCMGGCDDE